MKRYIHSILITTCAVCVLNSCGSSNSAVSEAISEVALKAIDPSFWAELSNSKGSSTSKKGAKNKHRITDGTPGAVCTLCYGEKRIVKNQPTEVSGNDKKVRCTECRKKFRPSEGHSHIDCPLCQHY